MDAGPEFDAWLAVNVADWSEVENRGENEVKFAGLPPYAKGLSNPWYSEVWHYSTDIAAAFTLVERLRALGFAIVIREGWSTEKQLKVWGVSFYDDDGYLNDESFSVSLPHAICLAAKYAAESQCFKNLSQSEVRQ
jgi:hypothetical protein